MDFSLTETQQEIKALAGKILSDQAAADKQKALEAQGERFDIGLWHTLAEAGLLGIAISENYGGMGLGFSELMILVEEVGRTVAPVPVVPVLVSAALTLQKFATAELQQKWLPALVSGQTIITTALLEEQNENPVSPRCQALQTGQNSWVLNGSKLCVPLAQHAHRVLMSASISDDEKEQQPALFLVDPQAPGIRLTRLENTAKEPQYLMQLDKVEVGKEALILAAAESAINWMVEHTCVAYCTMLTGIADQAMRMAASYTAEREQFGVPVATFQAVGHRAANNYIDVYCQRMVTQQAVSLLNNERPATDAVHIAKIWTGDCGHRVSYAAQHMHGGVGIDKDYPLWRYCVWARHIEMMLGSTSTHCAQLGRRIAEGLSVMG